MNGNLLHVDFKGVLPDFSRIMTVPDFWKSCGFTGVVLEFDARYPWQAWPGVWRKGLNRTQAKKLLARCHELGLETIPLIQIHGHLEWLLNSPHYAKMREAGFVDEICPNYPRIRLKMKQWISEVAELFSYSRRIHLGGDEAWHMATCTKCKKIGRKALYAEYFSEMSNYALSCGLTPMIWGDFFSRENTLDMLDAFPKELQLIEWNYDADCTFDHTLKLMRGEHPVLGASGIGVCGETGEVLFSSPAQRIQNVLRWSEFAREHKIEVIHTIWGRDTSLGRLYANWYAAVAGCLAAGKPDKWKDHPWKACLERASRAIETNNPEMLGKAAKEVAALPYRNDIEHAAVQYYALAMRYQQLRRLFYRQQFTRRYQEKMRKYNGLDETSYASTCRYFKTFELELHQWEEEIRRFFKAYHLSDINELLDVNLSLIREDMEIELKRLNMKGTK